MLRRPRRRSRSRSNRPRCPRTRMPNPRWSSRAICCPTTVARSRPMREVDQALARAYQRSVADRPGVPPAPHLPTRSVEGPIEAAGYAPRVEIEAPPPAESVRLHWPATIRTLERQFGDRFERLADSLLAIR